MTTVGAGGWRVGFAAAAVSAVVLLAGCASAAQHSSISASSGQQAVPAPTSSAAARPVPSPKALRLTTMTGSTIRLPGSTPSVLVFFSISCADCVYATHTTGQAAARMAGRAQFLAVNLDPGVPASAIDGFLRYVHAPTLPTVRDSDYHVAAAYQVAALSTVIVLDTSGRVVLREINPKLSTVLAAIDQTT